MIATIESERDLVTPPVDLLGGTKWSTEEQSLDRAYCFCYHGSNSPLLKRMFDDDVIFLPPYMSGAISGLGVTFHFFWHLLMYCSKFQG